MQRRKYKILSKDFLEKQYIVDKKSTVKIAQGIGCGAANIGYFLKQHGIPLRNHSEASKLNVKHFCLNQHSKDYIDGLILSDGYLYKGANTSSFEQYFAKSHEDWKTQVTIDFNRFGINNKVKKQFSEIATGGFGYLLNTSAYGELKLFYERWYVDGKKIIPPDLNISPTLLLNEYLGDGTLNRSCWCINLCTQSFAGQYVEELSAKINEVLGINSYAKRQGFLHPDWFVIKIGNKQDMNTFLKYIGDCPLPSFKHKWNKWWT